MADLPCRRLGHEHVLVLERSLEDAPGRGIVRYAPIPVDGPTGGFFTGTAPNPW
jgi:hypothetical protein